MTATAASPTREQTKIVRRIVREALGLTFTANSSRIPAGARTVIEPGHAALWTADEVAVVAGALERAGFRVIDAGPRRVEVRA